MPPLARFLLRHALIGFGIAVPFVGMLLWFNVAGLRTLIVESDMGLAAAALLTFFVGLTFGSLQMGIAVWQEGAAGPRLPPRPEKNEPDDRPLP